VQLEQLDMFGGAVDVTPTPPPAPKPAKPVAPPEPVLFDLGAGQFAGQGVVVDWTGTDVAPEGAEVLRLADPRD